MDILLLEAETEDSSYWEELYNNFSDANIDVYSPSELDADSVGGDYDVVFSELELGVEIYGPDILDRFDADTKAVYTVWRAHEAYNKPNLIENLERYPVVKKPGNLDLALLVEEELN